LNKDKRSYSINRQKRSSYNLDSKYLLTNIKFNSINLIKED